MLKLDENSVPASLSEAQDLIRQLTQLNNNAAKEKQEIVDHYTIKLRQMQNMFRRVLNTVYGVSSEAAKSLFNEVDDLVANASLEEPSASDTVAPPKTSTSPKQKKRKVLPDHLPREIVVHDLPEAEKICKNDGTVLEKIGEEVREELTMTPARIKVIRHVTPKYACSTCHDGVTCACGPKRVIPGSIASPSILASLITNKYLDHLPLYRQEQMFKRYNIEITRATMASWMIKSAQVLQPLVNLIRDSILEGSFVQCDETPLMVLKSDGVHMSKKKYMWVMGRQGPPGGRPMVLYELGPGRSGSVAERLLGDFSGYIQTDGLKSYDNISASKDGRRLGCMAHVRRGFANVLKSLSKDHRGGHPAAEIIKLISSLYQIESEIRETHTKYSEISFKTYRETVRAEKSAPIFELLTKFIASEQETTSTQSTYGNALSYAMTELPKVKIYLNNGDAEIDNNWIENMIRPFALGRKNWLFSDTEKGADASANIYTIVQTAKINGLNVAQYLEEVLIRIPYCETVDDFEMLLPWNFKW